MRPIRLELSGFASFREPTTIDFTDVELFVLSGPTGSGKSSVIDAMVMCLYGSVPRYDDKRLVAPVISQGRQEARIRLDFQVEGRTYTAVRVVRRTRTGATTKEARLEREDGRTLAANADDLTAAVETLLGLRFEHFVRTVVLPQGDFQEFLHAKPKDRQDLLVQLLDLDVYQRVARAARQDENHARGALEGLSSQLEGELAGATDDAVADAQARVEALTAVVADLDAARPELEELVERGRAARQRATDAAARRDAVATLERPEDVDALARRLGDASASLASAQEEVERAQDQADAVERERAVTPPTPRVQQVLDATSALVQAREQAARLEPQATSARDAAARAEEQRAQAEHAVAAAHETLEDLRRQHAAHALAAGLAAGDECPVCRRQLETAPGTDAPADLDEATAAHDAARGTLRQHEAAARRAADEAATAEAQLQAARQTVEERRRALDEARADLDVPETVDELRALVAELTEADRTVSGAQQAARAAQKAVQEAVAALRTLDRERDQALDVLDGRRSELLRVGLEPPRIDRDDLGRSWDRLLAWALEQLPALTEAAADAEQAIGAASDEYRKRTAELRDRATDAGVDVAPASVGTDLFTQVRDTAVAARTEAEQRAAHLTSLRDRAAAVREEHQAIERRAALDRALGQHLNARNFEKWLLNRALRRLVAGASTTLQELSSGAYSLALGDDNNFLVIDHRNADEQRSARTLSGGETFLASLSLALSLAEDVAALAAHGSARLDALFLDEGFGTLDADTLDVVASTIEELGSRGRMVGLITHVRELSERIPVRYEIRKGPGGSTVEKVTV